MSPNDQRLFSSERGRGNYWCDLSCGDSTSNLGPFLLSHHFLFIESFEEIRLTKKRGQEEFRRGIIIMHGNRKETFERRTLFSPSVLSCPLTRETFEGPYNANYMHAVVLYVSWREVFTVSWIGGEGSPFILWCHSCPTFCEISYGCQIWESKEFSVSLDSFASLFSNENPFFVVSFRFQASLSFPYVTHTGYTFSFRDSTAEIPFWSKREKVCLPLFSASSSCCHQFSSQERLPLISFLSCLER